MSATVFSRLKQILRSRGLTYADLALRLNLSEVSIKRTFASGDCKLSRLKAICRALDLDLHGLLEAESEAIAVAKLLPLPAAEALAVDRSLLSVFILLLNGYSPEHLSDIYNLSSSELYLYLRELEELELLKLGAGMEVQLRVTPPVDFLGHPALAKQVKQLNLDFLDWVFQRKDEPGYLFETSSRHLTDESIAIMRDELRELGARFRRLAHRDALLAPRHQLHGVKFIGVFGSVPFDRLLQVQKR